VAAMDLPCEDPTASFDTYADVVCAALDGCDDDVVLVGHSHGGFTIPVVAARRPVRDLVFLCAYVPVIGRSVQDQLRDKPEQLNPAVYAGLELDTVSVCMWRCRACSGTDVCRLRRIHRPSCRRAASTAVAFSEQRAVFVIRAPVGELYLRDVQRGPVCRARVVEAGST